MKFSISLLFTLLFASALFAQNDMTVTLEYKEQVDTIIYFDADTYEETIQIIHYPVELNQTGSKSLHGTGIKIGDKKIIYFDKDTNEEKMVITTETGDRPQKLSIPPIIADGAEVQVDTIIIFDPETETESMQIVKRKKN